MPVSETPVTETPVTGIQAASGVRNFTVEPEMVGRRIDKWLMQEYDVLNFGAVSRLMRTGQLRLDGKRLKPNARFESEGQSLRIPPVPSSGASNAGTSNTGAPNTRISNTRTSNTGPVSPASMPAQDRNMIRDMILFEDDGVLVINKPAGLAVQGGSKQKRHVDGLMRAYYAGRADPKLVHRLDRATSGVLLIAKNPIAATRLSAAFRHDQCHKVYWAIVQGTTHEEFEIRAPLLKAGSNGKERMYVDDKGKYAETSGQTLQHFAKGAGGLALVQLSPVTGRTHQLRAHMAHINAPILGDVKYGGPKAPYMALHAKEITFPDPATGRPVRYCAPLPQAFAAQLKKSGFDGQPAKWSPVA